MKRALLFFCVANWVAAGGWAQNPQRLALARAKVAEGTKLHNQGKWDRAEKAFRAALEVEPSFPAAYLGLARLLVAQKRYEEALPVLEQAKERYVRWAQLAAAQELEARQEAADRARQFADLMRLQQGKRPPTAVNSPGGGLSPMAALARARMATEEYLARHRWTMEKVAGIPAEAFYLSGLALLRLGQRHQGMEELLVCTALDAKHGPAYYNLAVAAFAEGDPWVAKEYLDQAVALKVEPHPQFVRDLEQALAQHPPPPRE